jgi:hypothetical protein
MCLFFLNLWVVVSVINYDIKFDNLLLTNIYNYEKIFSHNDVISINNTIYCTISESSSS